jgi:phosphatidylethanolamine/phosphatidyl-N-methylethanolamine N-methyltransferase
VRLRARYTKSDMSIEQNEKWLARASRAANDAFVPNDDGELALFVRRWLANPFKIGAIVPSAPALARRMARQTEYKDGEVVVELGPGTGAVTRALLKAGVAEEHLVLVERDQHMYDFLKTRFPQATLILGDARQLDQILPPCWVGKVSTVVSSLPLMGLPGSVRDDIVNAAFTVMSEGGHFVQYTYGLFSPIPRKQLGLVGKKVAFAGVNLPPASVWRYNRPTVSATV